MVSKPELNAKLYLALAGWENSKDLSSLNIHPMVPGYRLLRIDGRVKSPALPTFEVVMLCDTTKQLVYYNRVLVTSISDLNIKPATQSLVWRSRQDQHDTVLHKIAANVLNNYILNDYNAIVSDGNQTSGGKFFWESQISTAMARGNNVYFYKMMSAELERVNNEGEFTLLKDFIWGDVADLEHNLVIISKDELPLDRNYKIPLDIIEELDRTDIQKQVRKEQESDIGLD